MQNSFRRNGFLLQMAVAAILLIVGNVARAAEDRILWYSIGDGLTDTGATGKIQTAISECVTYKFNVICFLARYRANAYYLTNRDFNTYPNSEPEASAADPLQVVIDHAHEQGIRVYIAFSCFLVSDGTNTYPSVLPSGSMTYRYNSASADSTYAPTAGYPRAITGGTGNDSPEGMWADVGRADVRTYTTNILMDIVKNYDIDGVVLDRVRYPGDSLPHNTEAYGYNPTALSEMVGLSEIPNTSPAPGNSAFITARRNAVSRFITNASAQVHALKPWVVMGSSPVVYGSALTDTYSTVFQHFPTWNAAANSDHVSGFGNMDFIGPQYYRTSTATNDSLMGLVNADIDEVNRMYHVATLSPGATTSYTSAQLAQTICDLRTRGLKGFGTFAYNDSFAAGYIPAVNSTAATCGTNVISTTVPAADYSLKVGWDTTPPNPVTGATGSGGVHTCTLNWTPPVVAGDGDSAVRYLIYRGTASGVKQYYANQVGKTVTITGSSYTDTTAPSGNNIYYRIVAVDDYNNKSTAVEVGPVTVTGDIYVESRQSGGTLTSSPTYAESAAFTDTTAKSTLSELSGTGGRFATVVGRTATFKPNLTQAGNYNVYVTLSSGSNNNAHATYTLTNNGADRTGSVFLTTLTGSPAGLVNGWYQLESNVPMPAGQTKGITFTNVDGNNSVGARFVMDAVRFEFVSFLSSVNEWSLY